jgi:shikimate 5-dehydrogenase
MFDAVFAHCGLLRQFWKCVIGSESKIAVAIAGMRPLGFAGACITVPCKMACIAHLDEVMMMSGRFRLNGCLGQAKSRFLKARIF